MKSIEKLETIAKYLSILDSDKNDRTVTKKEFESMLQSKDAEKICKALTGKAKTGDWQAFKKDFLDYQKKNGLTWTPKTGQGGPISLDKVVIPEDVGTDLAKALRKKNVKEGRFDDELKNYLKELYAYLQNDSTSVDSDEARRTFKEYEDQGQSYKFSPGRSSVAFTWSQKEYTYKAKRSSHTEYEFGELILEKLKEGLKLDLLIHAQSERAAGKYRNIDFVGFKINRTLEKDEFQMFSFELKPKNSIESISQAVSQAVNYRYLSNFTYIVIPFFDTNNFYDSERFQGLIDMCKLSKLGAISVTLDHDTHELIETVEVLPAPRTEIEDYDKLSDLIKDSEWEMCPLCKKAVKEQRERCGWMVKTSDDNDDKSCMKELMEAKVQ